MRRSYKIRDSIAYSSQKWSFLVCKFFKEAAEVPWGVRVCEAWEAKFLILHCTFFFSTQFYNWALHHHYSRKTDFPMSMLFKRVFTNRVFLLLKSTSMSARPDSSYTTVESSLACRLPVRTSLLETPFLWMYVDKHRVLSKHRGVSNLVKQNRNSQAALYRGPDIPVEGYLPYLYFILIFHLLVFLIKAE